MNDQELKELVNINLELTKENNKMLKKIRGVQKKSYFFALLRWLIVLGLAFGAYYYIQPYLNKVLQVYNSIPNFGNFDIKNLEGIINSIKP